MADANGREVQVYSELDPDVVDLQIKWLQQYGIDGLAVQRYGTHLTPALQPSFDRVLNNVRVSSERHGRVFYVMYDLTGTPPESSIRSLRIGETSGEKVCSTALPICMTTAIRSCASGGLGSAKRPVTPDQALMLIQTIRNFSQAFGGVTIIGGVPSVGEPWTGTPTPTRAGGRSMRRST